MPEAIYLPLRVKQARRLTIRLSAIRMRNRNTISNHIEGVRAGSPSIGKAWTAT